MILNYFPQFFRHLPSWTLNWKGKKQEITLTVYQSYTMCLRWRRRVNTCTYTHNNVYYVLTADFYCIPLKYTMNSAIVQHFLLCVDLTSKRFVSKWMRLGHKKILQYICILNWIKRTPVILIWLGLLALVVSQQCYRSNYLLSIYFHSGLFFFNFISKRYIHIYTNLYTNIQIIYICVESESERERIKEWEREKKI